MPITKQRTKKTASKSTKRTGLKAYQYVDRAAYKAVKQFVRLAHSFPETDFMSCEDYPYPGHHHIFEETYRKLQKATKGHAIITEFRVVTHRYGYMSMDCEVSDDLSLALTNKINAILKAGELQSGHACTLCGAKVLTSKHLEGPDPGNPFCEFHSQDEVDATLEAQFEPETVAEELGIDLER